MKKIIAAMAVALSLSGMTVFAVNGEDLMVGMPNPMVEYEIIGKQLMFLVSIRFTYLKWPGIGVTTSLLSAENGRYPLQRC